MIIYYEVLFFINCFIHYVTSKITSRFYRIKLEYKRLFISFIVICLNMYLYLNFEVMKYFKYFVGYFLSMITFKRKSITIFVIYFSVNIMLAGTTILYDLYNYKIIVLALVPLIIIYEIYGYAKEKKQKNKYYYKVMFKLDKIYTYLAYLDTGNDLIEPKSNIPVVIVSEKISCLKTVKIPFRTIENDGSMQGIYCHKFYIKMENKYIRKEVYIVSKKTNYQALLNVLLF